LLFFSSIRVRLILLISLAFTAVAGVTIYYGYEERGNEERRTVDQITGASQLIAQGRSDSHASTRTFLETFAEVPEVLDAASNPESQAARSACYGKFSEATESFVGLVQFGLFDAFGRRICSSTTAERGGPTDPLVTDRLDFQTALRTKEFAVGEVITARTSDAKFMTFALPLVGPVEAVLRIGTALGQSPPPEVPPNMPARTEYSLVDRNGLVISSSHREPGSSVASIGENSSDASTGTTGAHGTMAEGSPSRDFITRVTGSGQAAVFVVLSVPPEALATSLADVLLPEMIIVSLLALGTLAIIWVVGEALIVRPAESLARAARRLRSGLEDPVDVPTDASELGQVGSALQEMTRELRASFTDLERALAAKEEFLSLVSHELRTPVTTILGNAQILGARWETLDPDTRSIALEDVRDEAQRLRQIIENLLVLARRESGRALEVEPLILRRTIGEIMEDRRRRFPRREYDLVAPRELALAEGNVPCIQQIMTNLLSNAEKYSPEEAPISVRIIPTNGEVQVSVEDAGPGVDPNELDMLFTPFFRSQRTAGSKGIGIGLSVCERLAEAQGGRIWAEPRRGGGSVFSFTMRRVMEAVDPDDEADTERDKTLAPA
jgi:signal transduction histidine kinase